MTRTTTDSAVGTQAREAGRSEQKDPRIEAIERLGELARAYRDADSADEQEAAYDRLHRYVVEDQGLAPTILGLISALSALQGEGDRLREALEPFAKVADEYDEAEDDDWQVWIDVPAVPALRDSFRVDRFRAARAALSRRDADA